MEPTYSLGEESKIEYGVGMPRQSYQLLLESLYRFVREDLGINDVDFPRSDFDVFVGAITTELENAIDEAEPILELNYPPDVDESERAFWACGVREINEIVTHVLSKTFTDNEMLYPILYKMIHTLGVKLRDLEDFLGWGFCGYEDWEVQFRTYLIEINPELNIEEFFNRLYKTYFTGQRDELDKFIQEHLGSTGFTKLAIEWGKKYYSERSKGRFPLAIYRSNLDLVIINDRIFRQLGKEIFMLLGINILSGAVAFGLMSIPQINEYFLESVESISRSPILTSIEDNALNLLLSINMFSILGLILVKVGGYRKNLIHEAIHALSVQGVSDEGYNCGFIPYCYKAGM